MALRKLESADGFASAGIPGDAPLAAGASTSANQDLILAELQLMAGMADTQPVSDSLVRTRLVEIKDILELVAKLTDTQPVSIVGTPSVSVAAQVQTATFVEDLSVSTTPETFIAPAGAFAALIETDDTNPTNIRVKMGATATPTSGIQFQGGRSEIYKGGSDISYCTESGTGKISVQWFIRT